MVVLNVKRSEKFLFLYETTLDSKVEAVLRDLIVLINLRLKVLRIVDAVEGLAQHGIAKLVLHHRVKIFLLHTSKGRSCLFLTVG